MKTINFYYKKKIILSKNLKIYKKKVMYSDKIDVQPKLK